MPIIVSSANHHYIERIEARVGIPGTLKLTLHGDPDVIPSQTNATEINIFFVEETYANLALVDRLVVAINGAAAPLTEEST
jgi:hypothetical protein